MRYSKNGHVLRRLAVASAVGAVNAAAVGAIGRCFELSLFTTRTCEGISPASTGVCKWIYVGISYKDAASSDNGFDTATPVSSSCLVYPTAPVMINGVLYCVPGAATPIAVNHTIPSGAACPPPPTPGPGGQP